MTKQELINRLQTIVDNSTTYDYCEFEIKTSDWEKYGKSRTYFKIVEKSTNLAISKHYKEKSYGYYDNIANEYVPDKYGDANNNYTFGGSKF